MPPRPGSGLPAPVRTAPPAVPSRPPCKTFFTAANNVAAGGEISVLTPGDYGGFPITKALDATNDGVGEVTTLPASTISVGIVIFAGFGDNINLRGLAID